MKLLAPAKINLFLHVIGKYENGYHQLESMFAFCKDLYDEIEITQSKSLSVQIAESDFSEGYLIEEKDNLIYKILNYLGLNFDVKLFKKIPIGAGLGGGSCDAGAIIRFLLENKYIKETRVAELAKFGADILPCMKQTCCIGVGVGDEIIAYPVLPQVFALIVKPNFNISTIQIYKKSVSSYKKPLKQEWKFDSKENFKKFMVNTENSLLEPILFFHPEINTLIKDIALVEGCFHSGVSGSGSACFGLFESEAEALLGQEMLSTQLSECKTYVTKLL